MEDSQPPADERLQNSLESLDSPRERVFFAIGWLEAETDNDEMAEALDVLADHVKQL